MKQNKYLLNTLLAAVLFVAMLAMLLIRVFVPAGNLPQLNIPNMVLLSLVSLVLEYYLAPGAKRCYVCIPLLSALAFGLLPLMAGFACVHTFWKLALAGCVVFTVTTFLFSAVLHRIRSGVEAKAAVIVTAFGIFLAAQCFTGIIL